PGAVKAPSDPLTDPLRSENAALRARVAELEAHLDAERRRTEHLVIINEVGRRIGAILNQDDLLQQVVTLIRERLGYDRVGVLLLEGEESVVRATAGWSTNILGKRRSLHVGITGWVARTGQPFLANDVDREPLHVHDPNEGSHAELTVPIRLGNRVLGVLDVQALQANAFRLHDVALLEILADQIAVALENARVYRALKHHLAEVVALQEIAAVMMAERDPRRVMETVADQARRLMGVEMVALQLLVPGDEVVEFVVASGDKVERIMGVRVPLQHSLAGLVLRERALLISH